MKKEDWTSELRNRLAGYEEPVPEGLWEGVEDKLPSVGGARKRTFVVWQYVAAAAVLLLAVVGVDLLWTDKGKTVTIVKNIVKETHDAIVQQGQDADMMAHNDDNATGHDAIVAVSMMSNDDVVKEDTTHVAYAATDNIVESEKKEDVAEKRNGIAQETRNRDYTGQDIAFNKRKEHKNSRLTTGLYAYNPIGSSQMSSNGVIASSNVVYTNASMAKRVPLYLHDYKEEAEHSQPVSFGLSLSYSLTDRLWLESGVVYTRLSSTFTHKIASRSLSDEQTLQYVGVPLRMGYTMWQNKRLSVYAIAGGEADVNVKAEMETEGVTRDIDKDRIQWSLNAAAGVQYNFLPQFGLYVEPGMKYYIGNGSDIDNIFKDKKLDFSIQVGLRCLLGK